MDQAERLSVSMEAFEDSLSALLRSTFYMGFNYVSFLAHRRMHKKGQTSIKNKIPFRFYVQREQQRDLVFQQCVCSLPWVPKAQTEAWVLAL